MKYYYIHKFCRDIKNKVEKKEVLDGFNFLCVCFKLEKSVIGLEENEKLWSVLLLNIFHQIKQILYRII